MRNLSGLRLARGYALFVPACVPRNSSPPPRCATHCPIFSSIPPQPQYSQNSSVPTSIPLMPDPCGSPDRGKSSLYGSIELQILGNKPAGRRTGHRQIGTLKLGKKIRLNPAKAPATPAAQLSAAQRQLEANYNRGKFVLQVAAEA